MTPAAIVPKPWNYDNVLRDDGMSYGDFVEQLTYLLFLKMTDERSKPPSPSTGLFYAQGAKANVLFFDKKPAS